MTIMKCNTGSQLQKKLKKASKPAAVTIIPKKEMRAGRRKPVCYVPMLQPTMRGLQKRDSETSGRKTTRSVWVRCLECTHKLHRIQRVVGVQKSKLRLPANWRRLTQKLRDNFLIIFFKFKKKIEL